MSGIAGQVAHEGVNTAFLAMGGEIFNRPVNNAFQMYVKELPCDGTALEVDALGPSPEVEEITSAQQYSALRAYAKRVPVKPYGPKAIEFPITRVNGDKSGLIEQRLKDYLSAAGNGFWYAPIVALLLTNPLGIDLTALLSDTHPYGSGGGTWDNKQATTLAQSSLHTAWVQMTGLQSEVGAPMMIRPTHLQVGPAYERMAKDLSGAMRANPYKNDGTADGSTSVVAAVMMENWLKGELEVLVEPRFANGTNDNGWQLLDLSKGDARPIVAGKQGAAQPMIQGPDSQGAFNRDVYAYTVRGRGAIGGFIPHVINGSLTGS